MNPWVVFVAILLCSGCSGASRAPKASLESGSAAPAPNPEARLRQAIESSPDQAELRLQLASLLGQRKQYGEALEQIGKAVDLQPTKAEPLLARAQVFEAIQMPDRALDDRRAALKLEPSNPTALADLGYTYLGMDWNQAAYKTLSKASAANPQDGRILFLLGRTQYQMQDFAAARETLEKARTLDPINRTADEILVDAYNRTGSTLEAMKIADGLIALDGKNLAGLLGKARALRALGREADADKLLQAVMESDPKSIAAKYDLASSRVRAKRNQEALEFLRQIYSEQPGYQQSLIMQANLEAEQGNREMASKLRAEHNERKRTNEALIRWRLRVGDNPDGAEAHFQVGRIYVERKEYAKAIIELKEAVRLGFQNEALTTNLVTALQAMNRPREAASLGGPINP